MKNIKKVISIVLVIIMSISVFNVSLAKDNNLKTEDTVCLSSQTYTAEEAGAIVKFDKNSTVLKLYKHVLDNNKGISKNNALKIAQELTSSMEIADSKYKYKNSNDVISSATSNNAERVIVPLGQIVDGKIVNLSPVKKVDTLGEEKNFSASFVPDSRTSIISEGWTVNPYRSKHDLWVNYYITWNGIDLYNSSASGKYTFSSKVSASITVGFQGNAQLTASEAIKYGLQATATGTKTSEISKGHEIICPAWTKVMKRPYIYYYVDDYSGTYKYYCYNYFNKTYFSVYEYPVSRNTYDIERSIRVWSRENPTSPKSVVSPVPIPPINWEW